MFQFFFQFINTCRNRINRIQQQKLALPILPTLCSYNGCQLLSRSQHNNRPIPNRIIQVPRPEAQDKKSSNILVVFTVHSTDYAFYCEKMAFCCEPLSSTWCSNAQFVLQNVCRPINVLGTPIIQPTPFENIYFCLNRACSALAILNLKELLHLFMTNTLI